MNNTEWIPVSDAAKLTKYKEGYVRKLAREGRIISKKFGHAVMIYRESILEYHATQEAKPKGWPKGKPRKSNKS